MLLWSCLRDSKRVLNTEKYVSAGFLNTNIRQCAPTRYSDHYDPTFLGSLETEPVLLNSDI